MTIPDALRFTGLQLTSIITGVMAIVMGLVYFGPDPYVIRRPLPSGQVSVVEESFAPVWPLLFTVMGMALIGAVTSRRFVLGAHVVAIFGWSFYGTSILIGALLIGRPAPIVTSVLAIGVAGIHFGLMHAHQDQGDGPIRRKCKR